MDPYADLSPRPLALTNRERTFVSEYMVDFNASAAAKRAGYTPSYASRLLQNHDISHEVNRRLAVLQRTMEVQRADVLERLRQIAFANVEVFFRLNSIGDLVPDFQDVTPEQMSVIQEFTTEVYSEGRGEDAREVKRYKFKMYSAMDALRELIRLNKWDNPTQVSLTVSNAAVAATSPDAAAEAYAAMINA